MRLNGIVYEALVARIQRRRARDLYHSALEVRAPGERFVIEMTPVQAGEGTEKDIVAFGAVGSRPAGRFHIFRYKIRRWRDGYILTWPRRWIARGTSAAIPTSPAGA